MQAAAILAAITTAKRTAAAAAFRKSPDAGALHILAMRAHEPAYAAGIAQAAIDGAAKEGWALGRADAG